MLESQLRNIIRNIISEEIASFTNKEAGFTNWYDETDDGQYTEGEDIPVGHCTVDDTKQGGTHYFHGNRMYPCAGEGVGKYQDMGSDAGTLGSISANGGPFLGHETVTSEELRVAEEYLQKMKPSTLVAYSRGGAIANDISTKIDNTIYLAPAWGRKYGASIDSINGSGRVFHGGLDNFVPVYNSVQGCINSGMALYLCPNRNHGSILKDFKTGAMQQYVRIPVEKLQDLLAELPRWGPEEYLDKTDEKVQKQNEIVTKYTTTTNESIIRRVVRNILLEKKTTKKKRRKVKCPLLPNGKRDYKCEYQKYGGASKKGKKDRAARNRARKQAERMGLVRKGDGMELDHIMPLSLGGANDHTNWQVMSRKDNRRKGKKWDGKSGSKSK